MIWRHDRFTVSQGFEDGFHPAIHRGANQIGAEFVADPDLAGNDLKTLEVKVGTGQVALARSLMDDPEGDLLVGVM